MARYWVNELDEDNVPDTIDLEAARSVGIYMCGIVDEKEGGMIAYAPEEFAYELVSQLNVFAN